MLSSMAAADEPITTSQARFAEWVAANREALESSNVFFEKFGLPLQAASHSELAGEIALGSATALLGRLLPPDEPTVVDDGRDVWPASTILTARRQLSWPVGSGE